MPRWKNILNRCLRVLNVGIQLAEGLYLIRTSARAVPYLNLSLNMYVCGKITCWRPTTVLHTALFSMVRARILSFIVKIYKDGKFQRCFLMLGAKGQLVHERVLGSPCHTHRCQRGVLHLGDLQFRVIFSRQRYLVHQSMLGTEPRSI